MFNPAQPALILSKVAQEHGVTITAIRSKKRFAKLVHARIDAARKMKAAGIQTIIIADVLNKDYQAINYYLKKYENIRRNVR